MIIVTKTVITILMILIVMKSRERSKAQEKQVIPSAIPHHALIRDRPIPERGSAAPSELPPSFDLEDCVPCSGIWPWPARLAAFPPGFLCTCSLAKHGPLQTP